SISETVPKVFLVIQVETTPKIIFLYPKQQLTIINAILNRTLLHLPIYVVQGRFDQVCPRFQADELVVALKKANPAVKLDYRLTTAGHSQYEKETLKALTGIMDNLSWPAAKE
ncbi:MAG TPA: hypothetical protein VI685_22075, partial [Candidatus Angelobacter sp.]